MTRIDLGALDLERLRHGLGERFGGLLAVYEVERVAASRVGPPIGVHVFADVALELSADESERVGELLSRVANAASIDGAYTAAAEVWTLLDARRRRIRGGR